MPSRTNPAALDREPGSDEWRELMGDDDTGHCRGCGKTLDHIDPTCEVCVRALCAFMDEEVDSNGKPY